MKLQSQTKKKIEHHFLTICYKCENDEKGNLIEKSDLSEEERVAAKWQIEDGDTRLSFSYL